MGILSIFRKGVMALGRMLVREGLATEDHVTEALAEQERRRRDGEPHKRLGEILVESDVVSRDDVEVVLARQESALLVRAREVEGGICVLDLDGYVDADTHNVLDLALHSLVSKGMTKIAINGTGLTYMNSDGIGGILAHSRDIRLAGGDVKFFNLHGKAAALFEGLGLEPLYQCFNTEREAIEAFDEPVPEELYRLPDYRFFSSKNGKLFHTPECPVGKRIRPENRREFTSREEALAAKRKPCSKCCREA